MRSLSSSSASASGRQHARHSGRRLTEQECGRAAPGSSASRALSRFGPSRRDAILAQRERPVSFGACCHWRARHAPPPPLPPPPQRPAGPAPRPLTSSLPPSASPFATPLPPPCLGSMGCAPAVSAPFRPRPRPRAPPPVLLRPLVYQAARPTSMLGGAPAVAAASAPSCALVLAFALASCAAAAAAAGFDGVSGVAGTSTFGGAIACQSGTGLRSRRGWRTLTGPYGLAAPLARPSTCRVVGTHRPKETWVA